jgi:hypothetical protein
MQGHFRANSAPMRVLSIRQRVTNFILSDAFYMALLSHVWLLDGPAPEPERQRDCACNALNRAAIASHKGANLPRKKRHLENETVQERT